MQPDIMKWPNKILLNWELEQYDWQCVFVQRAKVLFKQGKPLRQTLSLWSLPAHLPTHHSCLSTWSIPKTLASEILLSLEEFSFY